MPGIIVVGLQWGDEGKGKIVDLLSRQASHIVRSQGGSHAGHTIQAKGKEFSLQMVPSGILNPHAHFYITGGCPIDLGVLTGEIRVLESEGIHLVDRLHISYHCPIVFPLNLGTSSMAIRIGDLIYPEIFEEKFKNFAALVNFSSEDVTAVYEQYVELGQVIRPFIGDAEAAIQQALLRDETVVIEGSQGTLLDMTFGTHPYVSNLTTTAAGICNGAGISPVHVEEVYGVLKAYASRVGEGPLPTAVDPDTMDEFRSIKDLGEQKGCFGWLDLVLAKYSTQINGVGQIALTKLDVFDRFEEIKVCIGYELHGEQIDRPPTVLEDWNRLQPIYETLPGWECSTRDVKNIRDLPENARNLIDLIEEYTNVSVGLCSVGPNREDTIFIDEEWV